MELPRLALDLAATALGHVLERSGTPLRVVLWNGRALGADASAVPATVHLADPVALLRLAADPELQFGDLFAEGRLRVEGDLAALLRALLASNAGAGSLASLLPRRVLDGVLRNDLASAEKNARHHYDVGNEFYQLWLDQRMLYTCAYFASQDDSLEEAQLAKMEHVCRKLALRPGERVIEAGSGWGALALHMARHHGVTVRAFNVSAEQVAFAREQAEKQGLQERVEFVLDDWRRIDGRCDAFVSVGMLEHVGPAHYEELGEVIDRCLEPHGRGFLHFIGRSRPGRLHRWTQRRVFPNAHPPTLRETMGVLEPRNFVTLDVENLRRHYALTARHWKERFEKHLPRLEQMVGAHRARTWYLYLAGTQASFEAATIQLFQVLFSRAGNDAIPWTRAHVYAPEEVERT
jgi:cyclopropane-fatty-acyl-phospholipid synthase